jgi:hypothetical protein
MVDMVSAMVGLLGNLMRRRDEITGADILAQMHLVAIPIWLGQGGRHTVPGYPAVMAFVTGDELGKMPRLEAFSAVGYGASVNHGVLRSGA